MPASLVSDLLAMHVVMEELKSEEMDKTFKDAKSKMK